MEYSFFLGSVQFREIYFLPTAAGCSIEKVRHHMQARRLSEVDDKDQKIFDEVRHSPHVTAAETSESTFLSTCMFRVDNSHSGQ